MPDLPAPHHSAALNTMLGLPPVHPQPEDTAPQPETTWASYAEHRRHLDGLRRAAAARARARRQAA